MTLPLPLAFDLEQAEQYIWGIYRILVQGILMEMKNYESIDEYIGSTLLQYVEWNKPKKSLVLVTQI